MTEVLQVAVVVSAIIGASFGLGKLATVLWRAFRKLGWFLDAALGEPAQGNTPARPGMLDRMATLEAISSATAEAVAAVRSETLAELGALRDAVAAAELRLKALEAQMVPNGGGSLRDAVDRAAAAVTEARFPAETTAVGEGHP